VALFLSCIRVQIHSPSQESTTNIPTSVSQTRQDVSGCLRALSGYQICEADPYRSTDLSAGLEERTADRVFSRSHASYVRLDGDECQRTHCVGK
jgi:hypothetical protein